MAANRRVLFLCTHNSARSQMAEGLLRALGGEAYEVASAGTEKTSVRPEAVAAMAEVGIDISRHGSKTLDPFVEQRFDLVITVCDDANEACPIFPNAEQRWHWSIDDPSRVNAPPDERMAAFRRARDELKGRIETEIIHPPL